MKKKIIKLVACIVFTFLLVLSFGCKNGGSNQSGGKNAGLSLEVSSIPELMYDSEPINIEVLLKNEGSFDVPSGTAILKLGGYDPYSSSKVGVEIITKSYIKSFFNPEYSIRTLIASARSGNVIAGGDWQKDRILPDIIRAVFEKKEKLVMRNPGSIRPFQYVLEPLYGYLLLAKKLYEGKKEFSGAWNFGPEEKKYLAVEEMSKKIFKMLKKGSYVVKRDKKKHEADFLKLDIGKAKNILGWKPRLNISRSLKLTLDWYQDFYDKKDVIEITDKQIKTFFEKI